MRDRTSELLSPPSDFRNLETLIRGRIRDIISEILDEELAAGLGALRHERGPGRAGYRHGSSPLRQLVTSFGSVEIKVPRGGAALSKSAVSRVVKRLESLFHSWRERDLNQESYPILILDAIRIAVRMARRVVKVPIQAVIGVNQSGEKVLLELRLAPSESHRSWQRAGGSFSSEDYPLRQALHSCFMLASWIRLATALTIASVSTPRLWRRDAGAEEVSRSKARKEASE